MITIAEFVELAERAKIQSTGWMTNYLRGYCTPSELQSLAGALNCKADPRAVAVALQAL